MIREKIKCCFVCTAIILSITGCGKTIEQQIAEQLELGQKYFAEQDYEQALVAFNKMIEIDPKQWDAYVGIAEIYEAQEKPDQAVEIMEQGLSVLSVEEVPGEDIDFLVDLYRILADQASQARDMELTQTYYQKILELRPETEDIQKKENDFQTAIQYKQKIVDFVEVAVHADENFDFNQELILDNDFWEWLEELDDVIILPADEEKYIGLGLYHGGYIYLGEMEDGIRKGQGAWVTLYWDIDYWNSPSLDVTLSSWENDKPNGQATNKHIWGLPEPEREHHYIYHSDTGNVVDGVYEGNCTTIEISGWGKTCEFDFTCIKGRPQITGICTWWSSGIVDIAAICKRCDNIVPEVIPVYDDSFYAIPGFDEEFYEEYFHGEN